MVPPQRVVCQPPLHLATIALLRGLYDPAENLPDRVNSETPGRLAGCFDDIATCPGAQQWPLALPPFPRFRSSSVENDILISSTSASPPF
jgi:hypothetical protein